MVRGLVYRCGGINTDTVAWKHVRFTKVDRVNYLAV